MSSLSAGRQARGPTQLALDRAEVFIKQFHQKYPDIKVDFVWLKEPQVPEKLLM